MNLITTDVVGTNMSADPSIQAQFEARWASDHLMLEALDRQEHAPFEAFVRDVTPRMLAVARSMLHEEHEATDAVQEAFLSALRKRDTFDRNAAFSTWIHRILINVCLMRLRTKRRRGEVFIDDLLPTFERDGHIRERPTPCDQRKVGGIEGDEGGPASDEGVRRLVREQIERLPEAYREVVMLRDVQQLSTEECGLVLGLTPSAVKTRLHRARQALKALLEDAMPPAALESILSPGRASEQSC
ncbi:MAG: sigma-70 family RNA polymerase sigma factor [Planctomycetota bacterium]|nr:sigma-70 family RNA polymerase sigma factor [Planctomycetota bacterium]